MNLTVHPQGRVFGDLTVPGDKSIAHRVAMLAALADGVSCIKNFPASDDCRSTLRVLAQLGVSHEEREPGTILITGCRGHFKPPPEPLDCGNSGTTARLLMGLLAAQPFEAVIDGDASLRKRPMEPVAACLREMGAKVVTMGAKVVTFGTGESLPLWMHGGRLRGKDFVASHPSAQLKSAVLLAGLQAEGPTSLTESLPTRDHTERALRMAGITLETEGSSVSLTGRQIPRCFQMTLPGDISSGAFWMALAAAREGSRMILRNIGLNRSRLGFVDALLRMGVSIREEVISCGEDEWFGNLDIRGGKLRPIRIEPEEIPLLVDEIPLLAVMAAKADGVSTIRGAAALRNKETDRLAATAANLKRMGVDIGEFSDGLVIHGTGRLRGAEMNSFGDHRIAMACAIAGLLADEIPSVIQDSDCVAVSYPKFPDHLSTVLRSSAAERAT